MKLFLTLVFFVSFLFSQNSCKFDILYYDGSDYEYIDLIQSDYEYSHKDME